ncbi:MAG TPA: thiamine-phosphate kinase [Mycobacteriales bacterium]|nr:thiamine-phosphate kinase [Mycobacteriales bacterium]
MESTGALPTLADVGEFGLIARFRAAFTTTSDVVVGPGDDAAVVLASDGRVVATTDVLVEGRHFRLDWSTAYDVGRKAAAQNFSDIAAMGARPTALLVGLVAPATLPVDVADALAEGLAAECAIAGATVVGGDVARGDQLVLAVTALGDLAGRAPVRRDGARPGDHVVVVGTLGGSAAGLAAYLVGATGGDVEPLLAAHRCPAPPYAAGPALADAGATSLVDVSDGFAADLGHVLAASDVGAVVDYLALPAHPALAGRWAQAQPPAVMAGWVTSGGEDHALVATVPPDRVGDAIGAIRALGLTCTDVGEITAETLLRWVGLPDGSAEPGGFDHFGLA